MRFHCTNAVLHELKKSGMFEIRTDVELDERYKSTKKVNELYGWHVNKITLSKKDYLVFVNDLTSLPIVVGPIEEENYFLLEKAFFETFKKVMLLLGMPQFILKGYLSEIENILFTKTLNPKKRGPLNAVSRDLRELGKGFFFSKAPFEHTIELSLKLAGMIRLRDGDYIVPQELWFEELAKQIKEKPDVYAPNKIDKKRIKNMTYEKEPEIETANTEEWLQLYETAKVFRKHEPWNDVYDTDLVIIEHPETKERAYCSVMGNAGEFYGLALYIGKEGLRSFDRIVNPFITIPHHQLQHVQNCLMISFEAKYQLEEENADHINSLGLSFKGKKAWPEVKKFEPGYYPWLFLDKKEVGWLTIALEQVPSAIRDYKKKKVKPNMEAGHFLGRVIEKRDRQWFTTTLPLPDLDKKEEKDFPYSFEDDLFVKKISNVKEKRGVLQVDSLFSPIPVKEEFMERPVFPYLLLVVDTDGMEIIEYDQFFRKDEEPERMIETLKKICLEEVPSAIEVREEKAWIVEEFCEKTGIELFVQGELPHIDEVMNQFTTEGI